MNSLETINKGNTNQILLEYFAGRNDSLQKCEEYLREIIKIIKDDHARRESLADDIGRKRHLYRQSEANSRLEYELAKMLKVRKVSIHWEAGVIDAYSLAPMGFLRPGYQQKLLDNKYSNMKISIIMMENLVYAADLNERELLAAILHEIGHCYYWCPITIVSRIVYVCVEFPENLLKRLLGLLVIKGGLNSLQFLKTKCVPVYNIINLITDFFSEVTSFLTVTVGPIRIACDLIGEIRSGKIVHRFSIDSIIGYGEEKGADSFAAKYGYGPELVTALQKMDRPANLGGYKMADKFGTFGDIMVDLSVLSYSLASAMTLDPHPSNDQRAQSILQKLRKDLAKSEFPEEMEQDLIKEIERMEKACQTMHDNKSNVELKKKWYTFIDKVTHGHSDIRELLNFYFNAFNF